MLLQTENCNKKNSSVYKEMNNWPHAKWRSVTFIAGYITPQSIFSDGKR